MAENSKSGILAIAQKRLSRTKAKVQQKFGKAEKTTDDVFNENVLRIEKQQEVAHHLQKELKNYMHCVRDLQQASKGFHAALEATYESEWTDEETYKAQIQTFELLWNDYLQTLQDKVMTPMVGYLQSFPVLKSKVAKRGRKLVDYDNSRHNLEVLQAAKKKDEVKLQKAQEELQQAKRIYEDMNNNLHTELPDFYNSRVSFYASLFSSLFGAEYIFHSEQGKTNGTLGDISLKLGKDFEQFVYKPKRPLSKSISNNSSGENGMNGETSGASAPPTPVVGTPLSSAGPSPLKEPSQPLYSNQDVVEKKQNNAEDDDEEQSEMLNGNHQASSQEEDRGSGGPPRPAVRQSVGAVGNGDVSDDDDDDEVDDDNNDDNSGLGAEGKAVADATEANLYEEPREAVLPPVTSSSTTTEAAAAAVSDDDDDDDDDDDADDDKGDEKEDPENVYSSPPPTDKMKVTPPPGMLYMVQATHKYSGEDVDELNFDPGEVIFVIQFENPEEQDDGWQMGIKCSDGMKGVFPENFTQKL